MTLDNWLLNQWQKMRPRTEVDDSITVELPGPVWTEFEKKRAFADKLADKHANANNDWYCKLCLYDDRLCNCGEPEPAKTQYIPVKALSYEDGYYDGKLGYDARSDNDEYLVGYKDGEGDRAYS